MASKLLAKVISDPVGLVLSLTCTCRFFTEVRGGTAVWSPLPLYECIKKCELGRCSVEGTAVCDSKSCGRVRDYSDELVLSVRVDFLKYC